MVRSGDLRYASELVELIRNEHGGHFHIEVAAYPETHPQADDALRDRPSELRDEQLVHEPDDRAD
jgi:methylenetetrahydrofolate reductase (NADPH)